MGRIAPITPRVKEILGWYRSESPAVIANLARLMNTGNLAGTGKLVILPVDQGFEHGPARSFAPNPPAYDPLYHYELAIESGCNGYAAPLGALEAGAAEYPGQIPLILKLNNSESLFKDKNPCPAVTASVKDAVRLGCAAIGYTIYPGSSLRNEMFNELREIIREAREAGLPTIVWAYARGESVSKDGELAVDVISYGAHMSAQLGAHVIKVKPPTAFLEVGEAKKAYEKAGIPIGTLRDRVKEVVRSCFNGRRIVIFSGGETKGDADVLNEVREIAAGGAFGSIMGRNAFQRPRAESVKLLESVQSIFKDA